MLRALFQSVALRLRARLCSQRMCSMRSSTALRCVCARAAPCSKKRLSLRQRRPDSHSGIGTRGLQSDQHATKRHALKSPVKLSPGVRQCKAKVLKHTTKAVRARTFAS